MSGDARLGNAVFEVFEWTAADLMVSASALPRLGDSVAFYCNR